MSGPRMSRLPRDDPEAGTPDAAFRETVEIHYAGKNGETRAVDPVAALSAGDDSEPEEEGLKPLSERLVMELTAHRTLALRDALANNPDIAFHAALHALVLQSLLALPGGKLPRDPR